MGLSHKDSFLNIAGGLLGLILGVALVVMALGGLCVYVTFFYEPSGSDNFEIEYSGVIDGSIEGHGDYYPCAQYFGFFVRQVELDNDKSDYGNNLIIISIPLMLEEGTYPYKVGDVNVTTSATKYYRIGGTIDEISFGRDDITSGFLEITHLTTKKITGNFEIEYNIREDKVSGTVKVNGKFEIYNDGHGSSCTNP